MTPAHKHNVDAFPTSIFRARFELLQERDGVTLYTVADSLGWFRIDTRRVGRVDRYPDSSRLARVLGIKPYANSSDGVPLMRETVDYDLAVLLCDALGLDYFEIDV